MTVWIASWAAVVLATFAQKYDAPLASLPGALGLVTLLALASCRRPNAADWAAGPVCAVHFLLAGVAIIVAAPQHWPVAALAVAASASCLGSAWVRARAILQWPLLLLGAAWLGSAVASWIELRWHHSLLDPSKLGGLYDLLGVQTAHEVDRVLAKGEGAVFDLAIRPENLGLSMALGLLSTHLLAAYRNGALLTSRTAWSLGAIIGWAWLQALVLLLLVLDGAPPGILWDPYVQAAVWLPVGLIWTASRGRMDAVQGSQDLLRPSAPGALVSMVTVGAALLIVGLRAQVAGEETDGKVVLHEGHSAWEKSDVNMTWRDYGRYSTYNYGTLAKFLGSHFEFAAVDGPLEADVLSGVSVLIVKTPTEPYSAEEIDRIVRYVDGGGGLLLVGDHTDVFGTSTYLNPLAERFGLRFRHDSTYNLKDGGLYLYYPEELAPHPVVANMPPFLFATSCSLQCDLRADVVIRGQDLRALPADYSRKSYFASFEEHPTSPFGDFVLCASTTLGSGRVLAFTDSTVWSNFFMGIPGKPELLLSSVDWLRRSQTTPLALVGALVMGIGLLACGLFSLRGRGLQRTTVVTVVGTGLVAGLVGGSLVAGFITRSGWHEPVPTRELPEVAFVMDERYAFLPVTGLFNHSVPHYLTYFNCVQRLGFMPRVRRSIDDAVERAACVVLLGVSGQIPERDLKLLDGYIRRGGRVLVMQTGTIGAEIGIFGMQILPEGGLPKLGGRSAAQATEVVVDALEGRFKAVAELLRSTASVRGGVPLVSVKRGGALAVVAAWSEVGMGRVAVFNGCEVFSGNTMGHDYEAPTPLQLELYALSYRLMEAVMPERTPRIDYDEVFAVK